jgi:hypothetical protein
MATSTSAADRSTNACPACLGDLGERAELTTPRVKVRRCRACGHRVADFPGPAPAGGDFLLQDSTDSYLGSLEVTRRRQARALLDALRAEAAASSGPLDGLLDYGCGRGWFLEAARDAGFSRLAGADTSGTSMESLAALGIDAVHIDDPWRPSAAVQKLRFRPRVVTLLDVVEHIAPERMEDWLSELLDALRPDLRFAVIKVPVSGGVMYRMASALARAGVRTPLEQLYQASRTPPHVNYFSVRSMERLLARLGLPVARVVPDAEFDASGLKDRATFLRGLPASLTTAAGGAAIGIAGALRLHDSAAFLCRA